MPYLRQSTASQSRAIGPFIDDTDFKTVKTALTIANTDIKLVVNGGASANKNSGGGTHRVNGVYGITFDATDTATVGELEVSVVVTGALPVFHKFEVVEEVVYDRDYAASAAGYVDGATVNATQISGDSVAADNLENAFDDTAGSVKWTGITDQGQAQGVSGTTIQLRAAAAFADNELVGQTVQVVSATTGTGQTRRITAYTGATDTATVDTWTTTPTGTINYKVWASPPDPTTPPDVNVTKINSVAASSVTTVGANIGTTQPVNFTGTSSSALVKTDMVDIAGAAVSTTSAQIGVNIVQISTDATAADNAESFFDGTGYAGTNNVIPTVTMVNGLSAATIDLIHDEVVDGSLTARQSMRLANSANAGKLSGATTTTVTIRDAGDTKNRITATVDANGNRTAVTTDVT